MLLAWNTTSMGSFALYFTLPYCAVGIVEVRRVDNCREAVDRSTVVVGELMLPLGAKIYM